MWALRRLPGWLWRSAEEQERRRRLDLNRRGRITAGEILELIEPQAPPSRKKINAQGRRLLVYKYEVAGVTYEVAQDVSGLESPIFRQRDLAGQTASIKYDPRTPTNSIIACEDWWDLR